MYCKESNIIELDIGKHHLLFDLHRAPLTSSSLKYRTSKLNPNRICCKIKVIDAVFVSIITGHILK